MRTALAWSVAALMLLLAASPAAALAPSLFESKDGNLVLDDLSKKDWSNAPNLRRGNDLPTGQQDDSFGNGTKEDTAVPSVVDGGIPNNKSDLLRFYVANENVSSKPFLYLAWVRANTLGTANMDFEFNKLRTKSANGKTPVRSAGDMLITFDFASGGNIVRLGLHRWITGGGDAAMLCEATNAFPCWSKRRDLNGSGAADGSVNNGFSTFDPIANLQIVDQGFGEAAIDLTSALQLGPGACEAFGAAYLKSRSSDSFTAALKDFIAPIDVDINLCQPATVKVKKVNPAGDPLGGGVFELYKDTGTTPNVLDAGDEKVGTCTTVAGSGECSFTPLNGSGTVVLILHEVTPPPGYSAGADQVFPVTFSTTPLTITRTVENRPGPGTIRVIKTDDAGNRLPNVSFTAFKDAAPLGGSRGPEDTVSAGSCTTGSTGECTIGNLPLGRYWVVEGTPPAGYSGAAPQNVTIGLGSAPNQGQTITVTFVNPRLHKVIVLVCHEGTNTLHPSSVTLNGETKTSMASPPAGFTQQQLCALNGASFGGKGHGTLSGSVTIPGH